MKTKLLLTIAWVCISLGAGMAQLTVTPGFTAQQLADHLAGPGFTVTNATIVGATQQRGKFVANNTNLGVSSGVLLSTGNVSDAPGSAVNFGSTGFLRPGDPDLDALAGIQTNDAVILQFDFLVESDNIQFNFVFASEEYPEFAPPNGGVNDVFAFYISGPGITGIENIALVPGTTTPVSINNINAVTYWQYYVDNQTGAQVAYDAFTTKLTARRTGLIPCQTYRLSLRIADAADDIYDSAVFLEENSLVQGSVSAVTNTISGDSIALEGCIQASFTFNLDSTYSTATNIPITIGGSATNGVDYDYIDSLIVIPPGQQSATIVVDAIADGFSEGQETVVLYFHPDPCAPPDSVVLYIDDNTSITFTSTVTNVGCYGASTGQIQLNINGGTPPYTVVLNGVDTFQTATITGLPAGTYGIEVLDNYGCGAETQVVGGQYNGAPVFLPDGGNNAYQSTLPISGFPTGTTLQNVSMLQNVCVEMEHSFMGQLEMRLYAPNNSYIVLKEHPGGAVTNLGEPVANGPVDTNNPDTTMGVCYSYCFNATPTYGTMVSEANNYTYTYTDVLGTVLSDKYLPSGSYAPFQSFNGLIGTPLNGNWRIWVRDFNPQNNGWVCSWSISLANDNAGDTVTITQPAAVNLTAVVTNASCGSNNGGVNLSVSGPGSPYTYAWSNGPTTQDLTNIGAGSYTVTVTTAQGCVFDSTFLVSNTTAPTVNSTTTSVSCPGGNNGGVDLTVTGSGPFTYTWSNGATTQDLTNVVAGSYTVTVTGAGGCQRIVSVVVPQIPGMSATATVTDERCGQEDGGIGLAVIGGSSPYTYLWSNGATTPSINLVAAGTYTVTITDTRGCSLVRSYVITNLVGNCFVPCDLVITNHTTLPEACGNGQGSIDLSASSSFQPITYLWSTGATTQDINGLSAGLYRVTLTDANGCVVRDSFLVANQTNGVAISGFTVTNEYCGNGQGGVGVTVMGGAIPYSYLWSNGSTASSLTNLQAGAYTVTVTDGNGCHVSGTATVVNNAGTLQTTWANAMPETCGNGQGSIDITVTGGQQPLSYLWSNGANSEDLVPLGAGTYTCTVTDLGGCQIVVGPLVVGNNSGTLNIFDIDIYHENCSNQAGAINLDISGGSLPYTYLWSNGATTQDLNGIVAGTYSCVVTDQNGCSVSTGPLQVLNNPGSVTLGTFVVDEVCGNGHGSINLSVSGGVGPLTYLWNTASTSQDQLNLHAGNYTVTVTDANGCVALTSATVANQQGALQINNAVLTPESCGNHLGAIDLSIGGNSGPVSYAWSNGATSQDLTGLAAGLYTVTVSDGSGCSVTGSYSLLNQSGTLAVTGAQTTNAACGSATGIVDISHNGGTAPYTYLWSNGINVQDLNNVLPGTYTCTITDGTGCSIVAGPYTVANGSGSLSVSPLTVTQPLCSSNNGAIDLGVTGQAPFTYAWSNGATSQDLTALAPGTYAVTVTDGNGCQVIWSTTLASNPGALTASVATITDAVCGNNGGAITLSVSGGSNYTYLWSTGATTASLNGVPAGTYNVTVSSNGCSRILTGIVVGNTSGTLSIVSVSVSNALCGAANGSVDLTTSGGTPPITYLWSNGATTQDIANLLPGTYTCTISSGGGCGQVLSAVVHNDPGNLVLLSNAIVDATCGLPNGGITLSIGGATGPVTYQWSTGGSGASVNGLLAGNYTCYLIDQAGCALNYAGTVGNAGGMVLPGNTVVTDAQCGSSNGAIDISPTGGTLPYTYAWNNGSTTQDITGVGPGNYTVTVTDANGCSSSFTTVVGASGGTLVATLVQATAATCGNNNGGVNIQVSGGGGNYTYLWSNGATTQDINGVAAGTYTVTVTSQGGCSTVETYTVPAQTTGVAVVGAVVTDESCGNGAGGVNITVSGGSTPYTYLWSNGATTQDLTGMSAGSYSVTVTDGSGCDLVAGPYVVQNNTGTLTASATTQPELCGNGQGSVDLSVAGGVLPYTYAWSNGASTQDLSGLVAGIYTVTVTDGSGCEVSHSYNVISSQGTIGVASALVSPALCGNPVGGVDITPTGGTPPYTYAWSNSAVSQDLQNLSAGTYTLTLTDVNGCYHISSYLITTGSPLVLSVLTLSDDLCGQNQGYIEVGTTGGDGNYNYSINGSFPDPTPFFFGLTAGNYTIAVTDGQGCSATITVTLANQGGFTSTSNVTDASCPTCSDGAIDLTMNPPGQYDFLWTNGATTEDISNLTPGFYEVQVTDFFCFYLYSFWVGSSTGVDPSQSLLIDLYPNPSNGRAQLRYRLPAMADMDVVVVDMLGRVVLRSSVVDAQEGALPLDLEQVTAGQYVVKVQAGELMAAKHLLIQR